MTRTWEDNAIEFGALSKQGVDVRLAVLVATSVEKGKGTGENQHSEVSANDGTSKVSAIAFARKADTTDKRISRHLDAWNACAVEGWCKPSSDLTPADALSPDLKVPTEEQFKSKFDASGSGGRPRASIPEIAARAAKDPAYAEELSEAIAVAAPATTAQQVAKTIKTEEGRKKVAEALVEEARKEAAANLAAKGVYKVAETPAGKAAAASTLTHIGITNWQNRILMAAHELTEILREWETSTIRDEVTSGDLLSITDALITIETKTVTLRGEVAARKSELDTSASI